MLDNKHLKIIKIFEIIIEKDMISNSNKQWKTIKSSYFSIIEGLITELINFIRAKNGLEKLDYNYYESLNINLFTKQLEDLKLSDIQARQLDVTMIYQLLLANDIQLENGKLRININKHHRDNLGAYYTPKWLADNLVFKTVNSFLNKNYSLDLKNESDHKEIIAILKNIRVVDLSVGGGAFLLAYINLIMRCLKVEPDNIESFCEMLYGIDIDPIALLICKHEFSLITKHNHITPQLLLGNALYSSNSKEYEIAKNFSEGFIYKESSGLNYDLLPKSGFDIVIGNPPWEKIRFEERKFLKQKYPNIASISSKSQREEVIRQLKNSNYDDYIYYKDVQNSYKLIKKNLKNNPFLTDSLFGELNTYSLFLELGNNLLSSKGVLGLLVKSSMVKTPSNKKLFSKLVNENSIYKIDIIDNQSKIFQVDSREEFAFVQLSNDYNETFFLGNNLSVLSDYEPLKIHKDTLETINPATKMLPNINNLKDMDLLINLYSTHRILQDVYPNLHFGRLVHYTNHSKYISRTSGIPVYEGKFIELYNAKFATYSGMDDKQKYKSKASAKMLDNDREFPTSRYYIEANFWSKLSQRYKKEYMIAWRSLTSISNKRTMLATLLPFMPTSQSIQFLQAENNEELLKILAVFNSVIFDYLIRLKMPGLDLTQTVLKQLPFPSSEKFYKVIYFKGKETSIFNHIASRIKWLYESDERMLNFFNDFSEIYSYTNTSKKKCISELDLLIGYLYEYDTCQTKKIASKFIKFYSEEEINSYFN